MPSFVNDYSQGTHEAILNRLLQTNSETVPNGTWLHPCGQQIKNVC